MQLPGNRKSGNFAEARKECMIPRNSYDLLNKGETIYGDHRDRSGNH